MADQTRPEAVDPPRAEPGRHAPPSHPGPPLRAAPSRLYWLGMRFNLRLLAAIWLPLVVVLGAFAYVSVERERARLSAELERRSWLLGEGLKEAVEPLIDKGPRGQIQRIVERFGSSARGVAVYDRAGTMVAVTSHWAGQLDAPLPAVPLALVDVAPKQGFQTIHNRQTYYYAVPLLSENRPRGVLVILSDASHIDRARWSWRSST